MKHIMAGSHERQPIDKGKIQIEGMKLILLYANLNDVDDVTVSGLCRMILSKR